MYSGALTSSRTLTVRRVAAAAGSLFETSEGRATVHSATIARWDSWWEGMVRFVGTPGTPVGTT